MVDHIRIQIMERVNNKRVMAEKWTTLLCPKPQKLLDHNMSASFFLLVKQTGVEVYEVFNWRIVTIRPSLWSCTCREWNVTRIPCKHACAVFRFMQQSIDNYIDIT